MKKRNKLAVIGLGNSLLADEGAGLRAIDLLKEKLSRDRLAVDLLDAGTPGLGLLHQFEDREKIIFIDAGNCGVNPGEYKRFSPTQAVSRKEDARFSLHDFDLVKFLEFADQMEMLKNVEVVIYCIQAADLFLSEKLSKPVRAGLDILVAEVYREIQTEKIAHA